VDECSGVDCGNGNCTDLVNDYRCDCHPGWSKVDGKCYVNIDECDGKDCGDGICEDGIGEYTCKCSPGFTTDVNGSCTVDIDECATNPCENGNCTDGIAVFTCACDEGWYGQRCDQNCLVDADCDYKCSKGKCVTYSFFTDFKFYLVGIWCILAVILLFCASLKSVNNSVVEFTKSVPELENRQMYW
jgi:Notch-like protein